MADYQVWTNYETWAVNLWLTNDSDLQSYWSVSAKQAHHDAHADITFTKLENAKFSLSSKIKTSVENKAPEVEGLYGDLLNAALGEVNWLEIAGSFLEGVEGVVVDV